MAPGRRHFFSSRYDQELHEMRTQRRDKESKAATLRWEAHQTFMGGAESNPPTFVVGHLHNLV